MTLITHIAQYSVFTCFLFCTACSEKSITMAAFDKYKDDDLKPVKTHYESKEVEIPDDYLKSDPPDVQPITFSQIDFEKTVLPQYKGAYAVMLDNVLSRTECGTLLELAEASVLDKDIRDGSPWNPALVNVGKGEEALMPYYRKSDRIIWDSQEIVDRLWARISERVPEIREQLATFRNGDLPGTRHKPDKETVWDFLRVNKRLRFLKYGPGEFFGPHCDGMFSEQGEDGSVLCTHFTLHLYLNDSQQAVGESADFVGGATTFLSGDAKKRLDVDPKAGRVLIFQHEKLYHSGDAVKQGIKYTVRSDLQYKMRGS